MSSVLPSCPDNLGFQHPGGATITVPTPQTQGFPILSRAHGRRGRHSCRPLIHHLASCPEPTFPPLPESVLLASLVLPLETLKVQLFKPSA